jgi:Phage integrase family
LKQDGRYGRIGWHTFRHSHSSVLHALGVDLKVQQELPQHADIRTTMNIYTPGVPAALREANSKVVRLVLPAQVAVSFIAPLSLLAVLQPTVRKGNIGRGGGDRTKGSVETA